MIIDKFDGLYDFLSNFYECPVFYDGLWYRNSEAAFQAAKTLDTKMRKVFTELSASKAKYLGRHIQLRDDWEKVKDEIMYKIVYTKFYHNKHLAQKLIDTFDAELVEGNHWGDCYWGVCGGKGQNKLGKILMQVRKELQWIGPSESSKLQQADKFTKNNLCEDFNIV